jgi:hypothetical protein
MAKAPAHSAEVYGLRSRESSRYFYVGVTAGKASDRLAVHLDQVRKGTHSNRHFANTVRLIGAENITLDVLESPPQAARWGREAWWIRHLTTNGHRLVNRIHNGLTFGTIPEQPDPFKSVERLRELLASDLRPRTVVAVNLLPMVRELARVLVEETHPAFVREMERRGLTQMELAAVEGA